MAHSKLTHQLQFLAPEKSHLNKLLLLIIVILFSQATGKSQIVYVNAAATGSNNGTSWADAYTSLKQAIQSASSGQIWVAAGVYTPTTGTTPEASFFLKNNVKIFGGFHGDETALSERDTALFDDTILSGEIGDTTWGDNCYHVVSNNTPLDTSAVLDGFKITRGYGALGGGGGVYWTSFSGQESVGAIVRNCLISGNYGYQGGGIRVSISSGNQVHVFQFCTIADNTSSYRAGGFYADGNVQFEDCIFRDNYAPQGGCAYVGGNNEAKLFRCIFDHNSTLEYGAAIFADFGCSLVVENSLFTRNYESSPTNTIYAYTADARIDNCTFSRNENNSILGASQSDVTIRSSIVWGNAAGMGIGPDFVMRNCILQDFNGSVPPTASVVNVRNHDPLFVNPDDGNFRLSQNSPAIDSGFVLTGGLLDLDRKPRLVGTRVDMGAYEYQGTSSQQEAVFSIPAISVFPNPSSDFVNLSFQRFPVGVYSLCVYDNQGLRKMHRTVTVDGERQSVRLNLLDFLAGHYQIAVFGERKMASASLLIAH